MEEIREYLNVSKEKILEEYFRLLKIPSVSPGGLFSDECRAAAELLCGYLKDAGAEKSELIETAANPLVFGEKILSADLPTVLVYGHYDVMPASADEGWQSDPFSPQLKGGDVFARGAQDNKGQLFILLKAFEYLETFNQLPCNIKFIFEGNEETGSLPFQKVLETEKLKEKLKADIVLISDTDLVDSETPSVVTGLRGAAIWDIDVTGPSSDLHSGIYGGAVVNPLNELVRVLGLLHDEKGRVTLPGFYDDVKEYSGKERAEFELQPFNENEILKFAGVEMLDGETGFSPLERTTVRPTLEFTGVSGGYTGDGFKAIIPASTHAKIFARLVPNQNPEMIIDMLEPYLKSKINPAVRLTVTAGPRVSAFSSDTENKFYRAYAKACIKTFGKSPVKIRMGGSIGIVPAFKEYLGIESLLIGFGLGSDNIHGPNEHFSLERIWKGIETVIIFFKSIEKGK